LGHRLHELVGERQIENETVHNSEKLNLDLGLVASLGAVREKDHIENESTQDQETPDEEEPSALEKKILRRGRMACNNADLC